MSVSIPFQNFQSPESLYRYKSTQAHIVDQIVQSKKKIIMLSAPTGIGKSLIAAMAGHQLAPVINYVCSDKALQEQLIQSFPEAVVLQGRGNYKCNLYPHLKADSCAGKCEKYKEDEIHCDYYDQKAKMLRSNFRILNTHYLLFEMNYVGRLSGQSLIIIDEADVLESIMIQFVGLGVTDSQIKKYGLGYPKKTIVEDWIAWAIKSIVLLKSNYNREIFENGLDEEYIKAIKLTKKLELFLTLVEDDWIHNRGPGMSEFKPVWLTPELTQKYLFQHSTRFMLMSATLPPKSIYCDTLEINVNDVDYIEVSSPFKVENRIIKYLPTMDMGYKNKDLYYQMIDKIEEIVDSHPDWKGIIHSQSYAFTARIMNILGSNDRFISHESSRDKQEQLGCFIDATCPLVFVSPSCTRGIDLHGDRARFNICPKIPFLNLKDKMVGARLFGPGRRGQNWYNAMAAQGLLQLSGRTTRSFEDWSITYILDQCFDRIRALTPEWYREAIVTGDW